MRRFYERWHRRMAVLAMCALFSACGQLRPTFDPPPAMRVVEYRNGQWFDGSQFGRRSMYVAGDVFHERRPSRVDSVADLGGGYVVPPFADAHQHLYDPTRIRSWSAAFIRDGIYYVKDQSSAPLARRAAEPALAAPGSIDLLSANQGWTSPGGHPVEVVRRGAQIPGPVGAYVRDSLDPGIVMQVDTK